MAAPLRLIRAEVRYTRQGMGRGNAPDPGADDGNRAAYINLRVGLWPCRGASVTASETRMHIIGVGSDGLAGLTSRARDLLQSAEVVFGPESVLRTLPEVRAEKRVVG